MKKYVTIPFLLLTLLIGCQSQTVSSDKLNDDAEKLYISIKDSYENNEGLDEVTQSERDKFQETYIDNRKDYSNDEELVLNMEKLINSFTMFYAATGFKDNDAIEMYSQRLDESIKDLDKQFNK